MISSSVPGHAAAVRRRVGLAAVAGMVGSVLFVSVFTVYGWLCPGYSPTRMFVSELSLGPYGWVQMLNFVLTGALVLVFGRGLAAHFSTGAASRAGPVLVQCMGVSLMVSGVFATDPSAMFDQASAHGLVHGIFGALFFTLAPVSCFVFYRRFRSDRAWRPMAGWTLAAGVVLTLGVGLLKLSQQPGSGLFEWKGLVQRVILVTVMAWIFAVAFRLRHRYRGGEPSLQA
ncbi:DUF998 domain-containing protein [Arthrobacter sp. ov407]|uniref:DUF998 domain-containing protein n=1 Tax=Arthrobacter sp. ov407 TaxID=1761748 RepID=UPI00115FB837|nr:DUF998 domain-containing protein [Arthrobacter sp. ov407]